MPDYRKMYDDKEHLYAYDLEGRERTLEIERVSAGELTGEKNRKSKKPMVSFVGEKKKLALNKTNGKTIAALYGKDTDDWAGEHVTIYPTTTEFGGETVDCIRVRPHRPKAEKTEKRGSKDAGKRTPSAAAQSLVSRYEACASEAELAELKVLRGEAWPRLNAAEREAVLAAVKDAGARIGSGGNAAATADGSAATPVDDAEAAEIARLEKEAAARG